MQHSNQPQHNMSWEALKLELSQALALEELACARGLRVLARDLMAAAGWPITSFARFTRCICLDREFLSAVAKLGWVYDGCKSFVRVRLPN